MKRRKQPAGNRNYTRSALAASGTGCYLRGRGRRHASSPATRIRLLEKAADRGSRARSRGPARAHPLPGLRMAALEGRCVVLRARWLRARLEHVRNKSPLSWLLQALDAHRMPPLQRVVPPRRLVRTRGWLTPRGDSRGPRRSPETLTAEITIPVHAADTGTGGSTWTSDDTCITRASAGI